MAENSWSVGTIDVPENEQDAQYEKDLNRMPEEQLMAELRYWGLYKLRIEQVSDEIIKRRNNKENTDGSD